MKKSGFPCSLWALYGSRVNVTDAILAQHYNVIAGASRTIRGESYRILIRCEKLKCSLLHYGNCTSAILKQMFLCSARE